jgi:hypothetical protein
MVSGKNDHPYHPFFIQLRTLFSAFPALSYALPKDDQIGSKGGRCHEDKRRHYPVSIPSAIKPEAEDEGQLPFPFAEAERFLWRSGF